MNDGDVWVMCFSEWLAIDPETTDSVEKRRRERLRQWMDAIRAKGDGQPDEIAAHEEAQTVAARNLYLRAGVIARELAGWSDWLTSLDHDLMQADVDMIAQAVQRIRWRLMDSRVEIVPADAAAAR